MQAVVLAGGFGTRLYPLTKDVPKPMMKIIGKPILEFIVVRLKTCGITEMVFLVKHMAEQIKNYFGDGRKWGVNIKYIIDEDPLGTAGAVKNAEQFITEDFLVVGADIFSTIDYNDVIKFHYTHKTALGTIVLNKVDDPRKFGVVKINKANRITEFKEKPKTFEKGETFLVNSSIYVFNKKIFKKIPCRKCDFSMDIFPEIINNLYGMPSDCYWNDIGTLEAYYKTNLKVIESREEFAFLFE
jgi:NDP-sugar pyrophosphorylase family protein